LDDFVFAIVQPDPKSLSDPMEQLRFCRFCAQFGEHLDGMPKVLGFAILITAICLPAATQAQQSGRAADLRYCAQLSNLYVRYVGRSEAGPSVPVRPDVNGGVALAKCHEGDPAAAIPILERKLINAGFTLPPRG
jgi:hypothetical protein